MSKKKEINEKTFELNITNELLNLSRSFLWYIDESPISRLLPRNIWRSFLNHSVFYAQGLTQSEESDPNGGGYDVSINFNSACTNDCRLMFLQFKAGINKSYCLNHSSRFHRSNSSQTRHVSFRFNDAAEGTQHSTLRNLANQIEIQAESVMYVFPRITELVEFQRNIGQLIFHSSFVPVLNIDAQANSQNPPCPIVDGVSHKFRTSYDGIISEVNYYYFYYYYDKTIGIDFLSELICIQIERIAKDLRQKDIEIFQNFGPIMNRAVSAWAEVYFFNNQQFNFSRELFTNNIREYLEGFSEASIKESIPRAPQKYTTIIPPEGIKLSFQEKDVSSLKYQIF